MPLFVDPGAIIPAAQLTRPGQFDQTGDINAAAVTEYGQTVQHTIQRASVLAPYVNMRPVRGTNRIGSYGFGASTVGVVTPGEAPAATKNDVGRNTLIIDTLVYTRHALPLLETFQTSYDARVELGVEDGEAMARFTDQAFMIQAAKAALDSDSRYSSTAGKPTGFKGGSQVTLSNGADITDPARFYKAISDLFVKMEQKDVVPGQSDVMLAMKPEQFYALLDAEQIINGTYVTARGTRIEGAMIFKAFGCPVIRSNNFPTGTVSGHLLSTANNNNAYDGDFTKLAALAFSPRALLAGETIPLEHDLYYDKIFKSWIVDSHAAFGVTGDRSEYAGAILLP